MRIRESFSRSLAGMRASVERYPLTVLFLVAVAVVNGIQIEQSQGEQRLMFSLLLGAMLSVVGQALYERFGSEVRQRYLWMGLSIISALVYYWMAGPIDENYLAISIRTSVALFALFIAFIWIPTIRKDDLAFHRRFLAAFQSFFISLIFSAVLAGGISAVFNAVHYLLFSLDFKLLGHLLNPVYTLFAPLYFLSLMPDDREPSADRSRRPVAVPVFLDRLLSYIVIPLLAVYTLILVVYVLLNITGDFWTDNLLEPLLVSYAIIGIIVLILSYNLDNRWAALFRRIFPKVLIPIVVFQTIASILRISQMGITHGRYYVILFGIFAAIVGVVFSFFKTKHHGWIAAALLILAALSIVPPIDAFTVSRNNQIAFLEEKLIESNILVGGEIVPNEDTSRQNKVAITLATTYIEDMDYTDEVSYLPETFNPYIDFEETFGFEMTYPEGPGGQSPDGGQFYYYEGADFQVFNTQDDDILSLQSIDHQRGQDANYDDDIPFSVDATDYVLERRLADDYYTLTLREAESQEELISYDTRQLFEALNENPNPQEELSFQVENDEASFEIIVRSLDQAESYYHAEFYLFIDIK